MPGPSTQAARERFDVPTGSRDAEELACPFLSDASGLVPCVQDRCAMWDGERKNCAFRIAADMPPMVATRRLTFITER